MVDDKLVSTTVSTTISTSTSGSLESFASTPLQESPLQESPQIDGNIKLKKFSDVE